MKNYSTEEHHTIGLVFLMLLFNLNHLCNCDNVLLENNNLRLMFGFCRNPPWWNRRTRMERRLLVVLCLFVVACAALVVALASSNSLSLLRKGKDYFLQTNHKKMLHTSTPISASCHGPHQNTVQKMLVCSNIAV